MATASSSTFVIYLADYSFGPSAVPDVQKLYTAVHQAFPRPPVINSSHPPQIFDMPVVICGAALSPVCQ
jgi:hypothetical protein